MYKRQSLYLAEFASHITILARRDVYSAEQITQDKVMAHPKITVLPWRIPQEVIIENNRVAGLRVLNKEANKEEIFTAKGIFPYICLLYTSYPLIILYYMFLYPNIESMLDEL